MDLGSLVKDFGFPTAIAIYFIWRDYMTSKAHMADMRDLAIKAVQAIDKSTDAINDQTKVISDNSNIMQRVEGVLLTRGQNNERTGVN